jgi:hypothetical protein
LATGKSNALRNGIIGIVVTVVLGGAVSFASHISVVQTNHEARISKLETLEAERATAESDWHALVLKRFDEIIQMLRDETEHRREDDMNLRQQRKTGSAFPDSLNSTELAQKKNASN